MKDMVAKSVATKAMFGKASFWEDVVGKAVFST